MVKYLEVRPEDIENVRFSHRGRVSYPILKGFLETNMYIAQLDITGLQQSKVTLSSCLNSYINNHHLPVKLFQRMGNFYLMRLDVDDKGNAIENWETIQLQKHIDDSAVEITPAEVAKHALKTK
jgi:hypothetical protein